MYRKTPEGQLAFEDFYLPFGGKLSGDNRWVRLAGIIPWDLAESFYSEQFSQSPQGPSAKPARLALGALIIKERLGVSDEEAVEQIRENPYLQYFLGFHEFRGSLWDGWQSSGLIRLGPPFPRYLQHGPGVTKVANTEPGKQEDFSLFPGPFGYHSLCKR